MTFRAAIASAAAFVVLSLAGCRSAPAVVVASGQWTSARCGIAFVLPEGEWSVTEGPEGALFQPAGSAMRLLVRVTPQPNASSRDPRILARELLLDFQKKRVLARRERTLLGRPAACITAGAQVEGQAAHLEVCSAALDRAVLDVACWAPADEAEAAQRLFAAFLDGMRPAAASADSGAKQVGDPSGGAAAQGRP